MAESTNKPQIGTRSICLMCSEPIVFVGQYWDHIGAKPRHPATPDDGPKSSPLEQVLETATKVKAAHLEILAAAYLKLTNIPADQCELVEEVKVNAVVYYFRRRGGG